ncbi:AAA family ATPase [Alteromonas sp. ASW11-130]|uniref:AAA family ATPase n=1 Tax=Alteromonas sp. ASW11-130 TaxID=3015775 RepID=UPI002241CF6F|nr:AAA family ATPase [Alteromonas sp. ASW11-130]MCW8092122.1 AAA family ATPase [Alteromonas sp. ASW11-130]
MKFTMIYGPSGIGKESVGRELAKRNGWHVFPQHLAFDVACAVIGFGNDGFEAYQRKICLDAFRTLFENNVKGVVFTFCYVHPFSNYFIEGLLEFLGESGINANFIRLTCDYEEHVKRVTNTGRHNTNKIQSIEYLDDYLKRFDFSVDIPNVETLHIDTTTMSIEASAKDIERSIVT